MRVLVTGACGSLGRAIGRACLAAGHQVTGFDLPGRARERRARHEGRGVAWRSGDVRSEADLAAAVAGQEAVIHGAAILPPASEARPDLAHAVNVGGTEALLRVAAASPLRPLVVYPSSITVHGDQQHRPPPRRADEPVAPSDHYTRHKVACEAMLRGSGRPWSILRIGVSVEPREAKVSPAVLRMLFEVASTCRLEYVHPDDVGRAVANLLERPAAWNRVLLLGGGPSCQVRYRDLLDAGLAAIGLRPLPEAAFGTAGYYTDFMDTEESQALLDYQRHSFEDYRVASRHALRHLRVALWPVRPLVRAAILRYSRPWRERRATGKRSPG